MKDGYEECPVCHGTGEGHYVDENGECKFCDGYGFVILFSMENDPDGLNGWDKLDYTTYLTYLRGRKVRFRHSTNEIVIDTDVWETFFDEPAPPIQYVPVETME